MICNTEFKLVKIRTSRKNRQLIGICITTLTDNKFTLTDKKAPEYQAGKSGKNFLIDLFQHTMVILLLIKT